MNFHFKLKKYLLGCVWNLYANLIETSDVYTSYSENKGYSLLKIIL